jgi:GntR family transcriptional regulator
LTWLDSTCTISPEHWGNDAVFEIDARNPTPIYAQLERAIRTAIATKRLRVGDRLPTVRQLAVDLRVNANTVARVYTELERAGTLETRRGVGTFVASPGDRAGNLWELNRRLNELGDRFLSEGMALGFTADEVVASLERRLERGGKDHGSDPGPEDRPQD